MTREPKIVRMDSDQNDYTKEEMDGIEAATASIGGLILDNTDGRYIPALMQSLLLTIIVNSTRGATDEAVLAEVDRIAAVVKRDLPAARQKLREFLDQ